MMRIDRWILVVGLALLAQLTGPSARAGYFTQSNLVSNLTTVGAKTVDPNLVNPWGVANAPGGPFWVSNAGSNTSTLYDGQGTKNALTVAVQGGPTGQVFNNTSGFQVSSTNTSAASFIFDTLSGSIYAWNRNAGTSSVAEVSNTGAVYTGLALANSSSGNVLFAADNANNKVDVYDSSFHSLNGLNGSYSGKFVDPFGTAGLAVFNVVSLNGSLYVTYNSDTLGGGVIDQYDVNGNFLARIADNKSGGALAAPWSLVIAPSSFGQYGGDLLVSNNDNGTIAVYDPITHNFLGFLNGADGKPLVNDGIWTIGFGNTVKNGDPNALYIFAGINGETDGLIASISSVPEPSSAILMGLGGSIAFAFSLIRHSRRNKNQG